MDTPPLPNSRKVCESLYFLKQYPLIARLVGWLVRLIVGEYRAVENLLPIDNNSHAVAFHAHVGR